MCFLLGALTALVVLLFSAVAFTVLSPLPPASPASGTAGPVDSVTQIILEAPAEAVSPRDDLPVSSRPPVAISAPPTSAETAPTLAAPKPEPPAPALELADTQDAPVKRPIGWHAPVQTHAPAPPSVDTATADPVDIVYVTGARVNMRSGPGSHYGWVASVTRGTRLILIEKRDRWYKVQADIDGQTVTGWMAASFLSTDRIGT